MINSLLAEIFYDMADILEMQDVQFKPQAYRKVARSIEDLSDDVEELYRQGGLERLRKIPGVGESIAGKIEEFIKTGRIRGYEALKKTMPRHITALMSVPGLGPKKVAVLSKKLGISNVKQLEAAAKAGKISRLEGFGEKSEQDIIKGIEMVKAGQERMPLGLALPIIRKVESKLKGFNHVKRVCSAGSVRRMKETIGDLDILATSDSPKKVMDFFTNLPAVRRVLAKGPTKSTVILQNGLQADLRVVDDESYGSALQYFTGNKDHNIKLRGIAIKKGLKLSEYGIFRRENSKKIPARTEEEFYKRLGMPYIEPELRENTGEIEAAIKGKLPSLIPYNSIKGDLHVHSNYSDGINTIQEIAKAAKGMSYGYICVSDHSKSQRIAKGIDEERLMEKLREIKSINKSAGNGFRVISGTEVDILPNSELDYPEDILKKVEIVTASVHSRFKSSKEEMTNRIVTALQNEHVDILGHPTGRLINKRLPYEVDIGKVFEAARENSKCLEINAAYDRLDLKDMHIKAAIEAGVKLAISTDSHSVEELKFMELGVAMARRGWAEEKDIVNASSLGNLPKFFRKMRAE